MISMSWHCPQCQSHGQVTSTQSCRGIVQPHRKPTRFVPAALWLKMPDANCTRRLFDGRTEDGGLHRGAIQWVLRGRSRPALVSVLTDMLGSMTHHVDRSPTTAAPTFTTSSVTTCRWQRLPTLTRTTSQLRRLSRLRSARPLSSRRTMQWPCPVVLTSQCSVTCWSESTSTTKLHCQLNGLQAQLGIPTSSRETSRMQAPLVWEWVELNAPPDTI